MLVNEDIFVELSFDVAEYMGTKSETREWEICDRTTRNFCHGYDI